MLVVAMDGIFDCSDLYHYAVNSSGVYTILSDVTHRLSEKPVYCDMDTDGGG